MSASDNLREEAYLDYDLRIDNDKGVIEIESDLLRIRSDIPASLKEKIPIPNPGYLEFYDLLYYVFPFRLILKEFTSLRKLNYDRYLIKKFTYDTEQQLENEGIKYNIMKSFEYNKYSDNLL
jgi:hypothetical protein